MKISKLFPTRYFYMFEFATTFPISYYAFLSHNHMWQLTLHLPTGRCSTCEHCLSVQLASFYVNTFEETSKIIK